MRTGVCCTASMHNICLILVLQGALVLSVRDVLNPNEGHDLTGVHQAAQINNGLQLDTVFTMAVCAPRHRAVTGVCFEIGQRKHFS